MPSVNKSKGVSTGNSVSVTPLNTKNVIEFPAHPHDQHFRHKTYEINPRGGRKREKNDDFNQLTKSSKHLKSSKLDRRDDLPHPVLSVRYLDPFLTLSNDRLSCTGYKGWSSIFATHCAERGKWFFEVKILEPNDSLKFMNNLNETLSDVKPHIRVGWACRYQRYDLPIGHNAFGYALKDTEGSVISCAISKSYANTSFGIGDILGCYLSLNEPTWWLSDPRKDRKLYEFLQVGILCNPNEPPNPLPNLGSFIEFSINGKRFGHAFDNIHNGAYHPAFSLYMGAKIEINFGPNFYYPLKEIEGWRPANELMRPYIP